MGMPGVRECPVSDQNSKRFQSDCQETNVLRKTSYVHELNTVLSMLYYECAQDFGFSFLNKRNCLVLSEYVQSHDCYSSIDKKI